MAALAACTPSGAPPGAVSVPAAAQTAFAGKTQAEICPPISSRTFLSAFSKICESNVGSYDRALAQLRGRGYLPLASRDDVLIMAHPDRG